MQASLETKFQATNQYSSFEHDFGGQDQEGKFVGVRHGAKVGEGLWITKTGVYCVVRDNSKDDGTWITECIYRFA